MLRFAFGREVLGSLAQASDATGWLPTVGSPPDRPRVKRRR